MIDILEQLAIGSVAGVIGAAIFLVVLSFLRPRIRVSSVITGEPSGPADAPLTYRFKVVNMSRRPCVDVSIRAWRVIEHTIPGEKAGTFGKRRRLTEIDLKRRDGGMIPGYDKNDTNSSYAKQVRFTQQAIDVLNQEAGAYLLVAVVARDGWSGFPKSVQQEYRLNTQVEKGKTFAAGKSMNLKPWIGNPGSAASKVEANPSS